MNIRKAFFIQGVVQGVGFRPFVYRMAHKLYLYGFVKNSIEGVDIELEGDARDISVFESYLHTKLPPLARIDNIKTAHIAPKK